MTRDVTTNLSLIKATWSELIDILTDINANLVLIDAIFDTVTLTEFGYLDGVTSAIQTQLNLKATLASPVFTTQITTPIIALTGGQIAFPATAAPSAGANVLDDYEEGTWTMGVSFGDGTTGITYSINTGYYTKIGNIVTISGKLSLTSKGSSTGVALITGLPFATVNNLAGTATVTLIFYHISFANQFQGATLINSTTIRLEEITEAGAWSQITNADFADDSIVIVNCTYRRQ